MCLTQIKQVKDAISTKLKHHQNSLSNVDAVILSYIHSPIKFSPADGSSSSTSSAHIVIASSTPAS